MTQGITIVDEHVIDRIVTKGNYTITSACVVDVSPEDNNTIFPRVEIVISVPYEDVWELKDEK